MNFIDVIYQVISILLLVLLVCGLVIFVRSFKKRKRQLDNIEEKLDDLLEKRQQS
ncbi:protein of unknown function [Evansella caseinilytica]|uniref:DUF4083 domain-containing protein n=1 Tax=Evansella caseinilytica TaxID=1503961 RepID=A0A1H3HAJ1_9BACI|nr:DUF4083 family protein [Evansella caseinilytica]SDY11804.1 protein of unknown function [Evansella caseinilytica]